MNLWKHFQVETRFIGTCAGCTDEFTRNLKDASMYSIVKRALQLGWREVDGQLLCHRCVGESISMDPGTVLNE